MADWTYPVIDVRSGDVVHDDLPVVCDYFTDNIGVGAGDGAMAFSIDTTQVGRWDLDDTTAPMRRAIFPCRNGQPLGAYLITGELPMKFTETTAKFAAKRIDVLFSRRNIWSTLVFDNVDQLVIARDLMAYALGLWPTSVAIPAAVTQLPDHYRVPWFVLGAAQTSGVRRTAADDADGYQAAANLRVGKALTDLANLEDGFEARLDYYRDPTTGAFSVTPVFGYPTLGALNSAPDFQYPGNITDGTFGRDGQDVVTDWRAYGAGRGSEKIVGPVITGANAGTYPALAGSSTSGSSDPGVLAAEGRANTAYFAAPARGFTVELNTDNPDAPLVGNYRLGAVTSATVAHPRWPVSIRKTVKIAGHRIEPSRPGKAEKVIPSLLILD